ncbi:MAG TPA: hypothetical protein VHR66_04950 [Gemmataceae bacterium]|jgi:hypothetical protein|nr:hypothetical protein [Gemmataceae bacterium]
MTAAHWIETLRLIPEVEHGKLVIVMQNGTELCIDTIVSFEPQFIVIRGRQGGTIEEARGFIVPYDQFLCLRIERAVKVEELKGFFNTPTTPTPVGPGSGHFSRSAVPTPVVPTDPAAASKLLMERIRAVRANSASRTGP